MGKKFQKWYKVVLVKKPFLSKGEKRDTLTFCWEPGHEFQILSEAMGYVAALQSKYVKFNIVEVWRYIDE